MKSRCQRQETGRGPNKWGGSCLHQLFWDHGNHSKMKGVCVGLEARVGFEPTNGGFADLSLGPLGYRAGFSSIANLNSQPAIRRKLEIAPPRRSFGKPILNRREFPSVLRGETKRGRADGREICGQAPRLRWSAEVEADFVRLMIVSRQYGGMGTSVSASAFREGRVI